MAGSVDQVQLVKLAVSSREIHPDSAHLDRDAFFALQVHGIKDLFHHLAFGQGASSFKQAVRKGGLAMIDVSDNAEISDVL